MAKFKIGDTVECVIPGSGLESATVLNVYTQRRVVKIKAGKCMSLRFSMA